MMQEKEGLSTLKYKCWFCKESIDHRGYCGLECYEKAMEEKDNG